MAQSLLEPPEGTSTAYTLMLDFGIHNCESVNSCCFKPPRLWSFVVAVWETNTDGVVVAGYSQPEVTPEIVARRILP